ncbi:MULTISPECIES: helix-turn-helix transcriptional regulator [unclassified Streptomyces]|uniref:helix-turn-helix transcriptional regulator n=1 Tax=unclassified Streptomyces TaxID=2593676 RepID=UPI003694DFF2
MAQERTSAAADEDFITAGGHPPHAHDFHQLLYVALGRISVSAAGAAHELTPSVALWIPAGTPHSARFHPDSLVLAEPFDPGAHELPYAEPTVVRIDEAQRRLLLARTRGGGSGADEASAFALLTGSPSAALPVPRPTSESARSVAGALLRRPDDQRTATEWAESLHTSSTSLRRAFRNETGLAFSEWRTRVRLNRSLDLLNRGHMVSTAASRVGFVSTNGYILAFRKHFGCTPGAWVKGRAEQAGSGPDRAA